MKRSIFFLVPVLLIMMSQVAGAQLRVTEIMYDVPGSDSGQEWAEIFNAGTLPVVIQTGAASSSWRFFDGSNHVLQHASNTVELEAGTAAIIAADGNAWSVSHPSYRGIVLDTSMNLKNTTGTVGLRDESGGFVDSVSYDALWGGAGNGYSLERATSLGASAEWRQSVALGGTPGTWETFEVAPVILPTTTPTSSEPILDSSSEPQPAPPVQVPVASPPPERYSRSIRINELLVNPAGSDQDGEFIELYNDSDAPVDLAGWKLQDSSSTVFTLSEDELASVMILPRDYLVIPRSASGLSLNNTGSDMAKLYWPSGELADAVVYTGPAKDDVSYARFEWGWEWTEPARLSENIPPAPPVPMHEPLVTGSETESSGSIAATFDPFAIRISRFEPNPEGSDDEEWIELTNRASTTVSLEGWQLDDDNGSKPFIFGAGAFIEPHGTLKVFREEDGIVLNNTGDVLRLLSPDGTLQQVARYGKAAEGDVYTGSGDDFSTWSWASSAVVSEVAMAAPEVLGFYEEAQPVGSLSELDATEEGTAVLIEGIVAVPLRTIYQRSLFISLDDEGSELVELYDTKRLTDGYAAGDRIRISGAVEKSYGRRRVRISEAVDRLGTGTISPRIITLADISDDFDRSLVAVEGRIDRIYQRSIRIEDDAASLTVRLGSSAQDAEKLQTGSMVRASGFLKYESGRPVLWALHENALRIVEAAANAAIATSSASSTELLMPIKPESPLRILLYILSIPTVALAGFAFKKYVAPYLS